MGTALSFVTWGLACGGALMSGACAPSIEVTSQPSVPNDEETGGPVDTGQAVPRALGSLGLISPRVERLVSGVRVVTPSQTGNLLSNPTAQIALAIPFGALDGQPGLADLVAEAVAENTEGSPARPSLQSAIAGLGGTLSIQVGAHSTTYAMEVSSGRWREALSALSTAIADFPDTEEHFESIRERTVAKLSAQFQTDPVDFTIELLLTGDREGARARLNGIREGNFDDARAHHRLHYRPTGSVIGVVVPGMRGELVIANTQSITSSWTGELRAEEPVPQTGSLPSGIYWFPGEPPSRVAIILLQPDPWDPMAAEVRLLQECTTMSGLGGRFERAMDESGDTGFLFTNRTLVREGRRHLILEGTLLPQQIEAMWKVAQEVRSSYIDVPPSESELRLAANRAALIAMGNQANPRFWLETSMWQVLRQRKPELPVNFLGRLENPETLDLRAAAAELQGWPVALVVVGGRPPDPAGDLPIVELPPLQPTAGPTGTFDVAAEIAAAGPHIQRAIDAVGGPERLRALTGYSAVSSSIPDAGPRLTDRVWVAADRLRRERQVLATTVETVVAPTESYEVSGGERRELSELERRRILREAHSHPIPLLAGSARGELEFRYVSRRQVADREMVVLESVDPAFGRLRIHLESHSGLVRLIESWPATSATGPGYARETYSDYRSIDGLRVPFHRITELDNGAHRYETDWRDFRPGRPPDNLLGRRP